MGRLQIGVKRVQLASYKKPLEKPFFTASLVSEIGAVLEHHDSLPGSYDRGSQVVSLDVAVDLNTTVTQIPESEISLAHDLVQLLRSLLRCWTHVWR